MGVIGAGLMGSTHARLLHTAVSGAEVVAISDALQENAERVAAELGVETVHADGLELIGDPAVAAVVIASPAATHEPFTLACLQRGKPVLCEKPLADSAAAALRIVETDAAAGRRSVTVGFMRRYDPGYVDMKARGTATQRPAVCEAAVESLETGAPVDVRLAPLPEAFATSLTTLR
jgi:myo-inositol 2-dehydrogenase / D-chiro-inositol 1-dehydrogenase